MPDKTFAAGDVRVHYPSSVDVVRRSGRARSAESATVVGLVRDSGFDVVAELDVLPVRQRGAGKPADDAAVALDVEVPPGQEAVVLTERAGYWSWQLPEPVARGLAPTTATFTIETLDYEIPRQERGFAAIVLRFATIAGELTMRALEAHVRPGLVVVNAQKPDTWKHVGSLDDVELPDTPTPRILLLVHGTFSDTKGAFGTLAREPARAFLAEALEEYDAVVGYDHPTLSVDPLVNARDLLDRLSTPKAPAPQIDIISHSRGGLVARSLVERVIPEAGWPGSVDNVVFVAVPNAGTELVDPKRWRLFADIYTNLLLASDSNTGVAEPIRGVGALVKYLAARVARGGVPGLAAMRPGGAFLEDLNGTQPGQPGPGTPWFVVGSDFHSSAEVPLRLVERAVDKVLDDSNDLVVGTESMAAIDTPPGGYVQDGLPLRANPVVHHLNYFLQPEVVEALRFWLIARGDRLIAAEAAPGLDEFSELGTRRDRGLRAATAEGEGPADADAGAVQAHFAAEMPAEVPVAKPVDVRVMLSRNPIELDPTMSTDSAVLTATEGEVFTVQVIPKRNVTVVGHDTDKLGLPPGGGTSDVVFSVTATGPGPVAVNVVIRRSQTDIAAGLTLHAEAVEGDEAAGRQELTRTQVQAAARTSVVVDDAVWLEISELQHPEGADDIVKFQYDLRLPDSPTVFRYTSAPLRDRAGYVTKLLNGIERQWSECAGDDAKFLRYLQDRGSRLFEELFPQALQSRLWSHRNDITSIVVLADEPYFPWELVHLKPPVGPRQKKPLFLAQYGLLRWQFLPFPASAELRARPGKVYAVCPEYVDPQYTLAESSAEADFLARKLNAKAVTATEAGVRKMLRRGDFDVLHFSGHGAAKTADVAEAVILLKGRRVDGTFTREFLSATTVAENASLRHPDGSGPLVVLNACQVGIGGEQLASLGGFARAFLEAGAQAVVACLWSVKQGPSRVFVETLYERLLSGDVMRDAAGFARAAARAEGDSATSLAFVVYARPDAKLVLG